VEKKEAKNEEKKAETKVTEAKQVDAKAQVVKGELNAVADKKLEAVAVKVLSESSHSSHSLESAVAAQSLASALVKTSETKLKKDATDIKVDKQKLEDAKKDAKAKEVKVAEKTGLLNAAVKKIRDLKHQQQHLINKESSESGKSDGENEVKLKAIGDQLERVVNDVQELEIELKKAVAQEKEALDEVKKLKARVGADKSSEASDSQSIHSSLSHLSEESSSESSSMKSMIQKLLQKTSPSFF